ncbi:hypothetical protein ACFX2J_038243 [Malus domestica]
MQSGGENERELGGGPFVAVGREEGVGQSASKQRPLLRVGLFDCVLSMDVWRSSGGLGISRSFVFFFVFLERKRQGELKGNEDALGLFVAATGESVDKISV